MFLMALIGCHNLDNPRVYPTDIEKFSNVCHKNDGVEYFIMDCGSTRMQEGFVDKCEVRAAQCNDGAYLSNNAIKLQMEKTQ